MREPKKTALYYMRRNKGMSQRELARRAHMDASMVGWIESGRFIPYHSQLEKIAAALDYKGNPENIVREMGEE